jgi:hypothetical protein
VELIEASGTRLRSGGSIEVGLQRTDRRTDRLADNVWYLRRREKTSEVQQTTAGYGKLRDGSKGRQGWGSWGFLRRSTCGRLGARSGLGRSEEIECINRRC